MFLINRKKKLINFKHVSNYKLKLKLVKNYNLI